MAIKLVASARNRCQIASYINRREEKKKTNKVPYVMQMHRSRTPSYLALSIVFRRRRKLIFGVNVVGFGD